MVQIRVSGGGWLHLSGQRYRCALGRAGISGQKSEGDGATPAGRFPVRRLLYRPDRLARPESPLPLTAIQTNDGWCDDPGDGAYNRAVTLPHGASAESLWRDDHLYDLVVIIGHNDDPVTPGLGSAIFMHVAAPGYGPTEGCIALARPDLLAILRELDTDSKILIKP
jgi:L,D-peptidoglycan transpeptidase YkuD (ErfK/YbiS/YcfS/YnhG family)